MLFIPPGVLFPFGTMTRRWAHPILAPCSPLVAHKYMQPSAGAAGGPPGTLVPIGTMHAQHIYNNSCYTYDRLDST